MTQCRNMLSSSRDTHAHTQTHVHQGHASEQYTIYKLNYLYYYFQNEINAYFPSNQDDLILYTPNNSLTFKIMENVRYKMDIIEES